MRARLRVEGPRGSLVATEPALDEIGAHASALADAYNEPHNRGMLANTIEFTPADVVAHYAAMSREGARPFFLYEDGAFVGDADFRHLSGDHAEFAMLVASRSNQGRGLGTELAILLHAAAFRAFGLARVYVTIVPENAASLRLFTKLGYTVDTSAEARAYADEPGDVAMSVTRATFERAHADVVAGVRIASV
jgi:RimJ/RimL family protein N-acetyltransferase